MSTGHTVSVVANCDCCDNSPGTARVLAFGIETWACDECRGVKPEARTAQSSRIGPAHVFADADNNGLNARVLIEAFTDETQS